MTLTTVDCDLRHGDCREILASLPAGSVAAIVTDPPFGIRKSGTSWDRQEIENIGDTHNANNPARALASVAGSYDTSPAGRQAFREWTAKWVRAAAPALRDDASIFSFCSARLYHHMAYGIEDAGFEVRDLVAWLFGMTMPHTNYMMGNCLEPVAVAVREGVPMRLRARLEADTTGRYPRNVAVDEEVEKAIGAPYFFQAKTSPGEKRLGSLGERHATIKPVKLMRWLIRLASDPGDLIVDPFLGSGTTGAAALLEGRRFLGIEREADSFQFARTRIADTIYPWGLRLPTEEETHDRPA